MKLPLTLAHGPGWFFAVLGAIQLSSWLFSIFSVGLALAKRKIKYAFTSGLAGALLSLVLLFFIVGAGDKIDWIDPWFYVTAGPVPIGVIGAILSFCARNEPRA